MRGHLTPIQYGQGHKACDTTELLELYSSLLKAPRLLRNNLELKNRERSLSPGVPAAELTD